MGVYIKGMVMPTSCWDCYFQDCGNCVLNNHKVVDKCIIEDRRDEDCPLVEIPPHGRLIDADALIEDMARMVPWAITDPTESAFLDGLSAAYEAIKASPTIIEAEEGE